MGASARGQQPPSLGSNAARAPPPPPPPSPSPTEAATLPALPADVLARVAALLAPRDLLALAATCTTLRPLAADAVVWRALEVAHLPRARPAPVCVDADAGAAAQDPSPSAATPRELFFSQASKLRGRWHVATGAIVRGVPVHLRSGIFAIVRAHGGVEKTIPHGRSSKDAAAYVMKTEAPIPPVSVVSLGTANAGAALSVGDYAHPQQAHPTASTAHATPAGSSDVLHHPHDSEANSLIVPGQVVTSTPGSISTALTPFVELDFKVGVKGVPFPAAGLALRLVHALQLEIGASAADALDAVRLDVILNGVKITSAMSVSAEGVNNFVNMDVILEPSLLHENGRMNTIAIRYSGPGGAAYWLKGVFMAPVVLGLGAFDAAKDGGSLPVALPSLRMRTATPVRGACKYSCYPIYRGSPTSISGYF